MKIEKMVNRQNPFKCYCGASIFRAWVYAPAKKDSNFLALKRKSFDDGTTSPHMCRR